MRTVLGFVGGVVAATLVGAAAMKFGTPLDASFTYLGQLRDAGQLVNGTADLRFTLWDAEAGGTQIGAANSVTDYQVVDGRFATSLNFGADAFNGDQRWVQIEFRSPAGSGEYLTLAPRDKITAAPYALYALNSVESQWSYNPKQQAVTTSVPKVGIGTTTPTAQLEVAGAGGDSAVKLPSASIGAQELAVNLPRARVIVNQVPAGSFTTFLYGFSVPANGYVLIQIAGNFSQCPTYGLDGVALAGSQSLRQVTAGSHTISCNTTCNGGALSNTIAITFFEDVLP